MSNEDWDLFAPVLSTDVAKLRPTQPAPDVSENVTPDEPRKKRSKVKKITQATRKPPESQEDIDAWIAERKKRFPTRQRIAEKEQVQAERDERGALDLSVTEGKKRRKTAKGGTSERPIEMSTKQLGQGRSMLDRLMDDEVRRQRSIVLQCFRYFRSRNFLQDE